MNTTKNRHSLGLMFLISGIALFSVGLTTSLPALWIAGTPLITLGIVFLAISKSRQNTQGNKA